MGETKPFYFHNLSNSSSFELIDDTLIGRADSSDITIYDDKISGKHLHLTVNDDSIFIKDLGTSNGTLLNGLEIVAKQKYEVREGDKIVIGRITLLLSKTKHLENNQTSQQDNLRELDSFDKSGVELEFEGGHKFIAEVGDMEAPKKMIRNENIKIKKIKRELDKIDSKMERKKDFLVKLEELKSEHVEILEEGPKLKKIYNENLDEWKGINLKLKKIEREHNKLKELRLKISPVMEKYEIYKEIALEQSNLLNEVKSLSRENLNAKKKGCNDRIDELQKNIFTCEQKILELDLERQREKERDKERIKKQIAELQAKLDETG
jgi:pSer/pThr/pTyr-binding forkhead associated (FHA) protein